MKARPTHNPTLAFIKPDYQGNLLNQIQQYTNLDGPSERTLSEVLRWQTSRKALKPLKKNQQSDIPIHKDGLFVNDLTNGMTWLGHCTFYITLNRFNIITDPVLGKVSNIMPRYTELPISPDKLHPIDLILISHNHRDHLDKKSMQLLCKLNPHAVIYTGLEIGKIIRQWKITNQVVEAGWYQSFPTLQDIQISYLPAKHWNRRALRDTNEMLWGSFMLQHASTTIYFGADSGYGVHFKEIGALYPCIDIAMIGIGAYQPEWFMHTSHTGPADALQVMQDLNAAQLIPMHHGTFDLSDEPIFYPQQELQRLIAHDVTLQQKINFMPIGKKYIIQ